MEGSNELTVLAEVSVALAGFSGLVVAVRRGESSHPWETFRAVALLITGFSVLLQSLFPFVIHSFGATGPSIWRLSSALGLLMNLAPILPLNRHMPPGFSSSEYYRLNSTLQLAAVSVAVGAHLANVFALGTEGSFSLFYLGAIINVPMVAVQFLVVLVAAPRD